MNIFGKIKLKDIPRIQFKIIRQSSNTRPALRLIEKGGQKAVVKDFSSNGYLFRNLIGRFLIKRESKAYHLLKGLKGIPKFYGSIEGLALITEEIPGKNIESLNLLEKLPNDFFKDLRRIIDEFHKRGIAHCDLKRAPNVILGDDLKPYIVDWSASIRRQYFGVYPLNLIYKRFERDDLNAIIKLKLKFCPDKVSDEEKRQYFYRSPLERIIRSIRDWARLFLQKIA